MSQTLNKACCTIPPVQSEYSPKGTVITIGGLDAYEIGPKNSNKAIVVVYDVFGFWPTTKQGADLLAAATDARIVMPDFFRGKPLSQDYLPANTDEKRTYLQKFFAGNGDFKARGNDLSAVAAELKTDGATNLGIFGHCWGGKLSVLAGGQNSAFRCVGQVHPAFLDPMDAAQLTVPVANFPSKDENADAVEKFEAAVQKLSFANECVYKRYSVHHGWAAARANLNDKDNFDAFRDVYQRLADFFNRHLG